MSMLNMLKTGGRAAIVIATLGAAGLFAAAPAQAAPPPFSFQFGIGNGFGFGGPGNGIVLQFGDDNYFDYCLTNSQVRSQLRQYGYSNVKIVKEYNSSNKVIAIGYDDGAWYQMRVDRCTGKVDRIREIEQSNNGNFTLQLNF